MRKSTTALNRIVRVKNEALHKLLLHVSQSRNVPYQFVFNCWLDYTEGPEFGGALGPIEGFDEYVDYCLARGDNYEDF